MSVPAPAGEKSNFNPGTNSSGATQNNQNGNAPPNKTPGVGSTRLSNAIQLQLKVLQKCAERLTQEKDQVNAIRELLDQSILDLDKEIAVIHRMKELAEEAELFQRNIIAMGPRPE